MGEFKRGPRKSSGPRSSGPRKSSGRGSGPRRDSGFRGPQRRSFGPREMHKATCSECGQECEVPFKPTEGKPVFCQECYRKKKGF